MGIQPVGSIDSSKHYGSELSFEVTDGNGFNVSYSTSTANTVGSGKDKIICDGVQNQKISIQERTNMIRLTGKVSVYLRYSETFEKHVFVCNYVDLKMYPVYDQRFIFGALRCDREIINS